MARVNVIQKARKAQGKCTKCGTEIKVGDPYRFWKFRFGAPIPRCMKTECTPRPSDLTQSEFYIRLYEIQESLEVAMQDFNDNGELSDLSSSISSAADQVRELGEECQEKLDNMPEGLQAGDSGQLLENRAQECEGKADELEEAAGEIDNLELHTDVGTYIEDNGLEREEKETEEEYRLRAKDEMEDANDALREEAVGNLDTDLSIE